LILDPEQCGQAHRVPAERARTEEAGQGQDDYHAHPDPAGPLDSPGTAREGQILIDLQAVGPASLHVPAWSATPVPPKTA